MTIKQISVFVENRPGRLCEVLEILERQQVDIRALSIADTTSYGILRLIVSNPDRAQEPLKEAGYTVALTDVIAVGVADRPGGLSEALHHLADAQISVEYMYAFVSKREHTAYVILRVENNAAALEVLTRHNLPILTGKELYDL